MTISRNITVDDSLNIVNDYVVNHLSSKKLRVKYHTSPNTIIEILKKAGVMRSKSASAANQFTNVKSDQVASFKNVGDDVLLNLAKIGLSQEQLVRLFSLSSNSQMVRKRLSAVNYSDVRRKSRENWLVNVDSSIKFNMFKNVDSFIWEVLYEHLTIDEISEGLGVSTSFIQSQLSKFKLNMSGNNRMSFIKQNFPDNKKLGDWVYQSYAHPEFVQYLISMFPDVTLLELSRFFNDSVASARDFANKNHLNVLTTTNFGSSYETKVLKALRKVYDGRVIYRDHSVLEGRELDFYLPDAHVGIEVSPAATHSVTGYSVLKSYDRQYHYKKRLLAQSKGVTLLTLFSNLLSDDYIENQLPIIFSHYLSDKYNSFSGDLRYYYLSRDKGKQLVERLNVMKYGSNISDVVGIMSRDKLIACGVLGKYQRESLFSSIKILGIFSDYTLPISNKVLKTLIGAIYSKYGNISIYGQTGRLFGTGEYYLENGFKFVKYERPREHYYLANKVGDLPLSENVIYKHHVSREKLLDDGYVPVFDCGCGIYKYQGTLGDFND